MAALLVLPAIGPAIANAQVPPARVIHVDPVTLHNQSDSATVRIPVPKGVTPSVFRADVRIPMLMDSGEIEVSSGDTVLGRLALSGTNDHTDIEVPLVGAKAADGFIDLAFRTSLRAGPEACPDWSTENVEITDARVDFSGAPAKPQSIADFTTSYLEKLEIYLPDTPTTAEAQAAARLATTEVSRFGNDHFAVEVLPASAPKPAEDTPFIRRAIIREGPEKNVRLTGDDVPTMEVTGSGEELSQQVDLVQSKLWNVAVDDQLSIDGDVATPKAAMDSATLDELDAGTISAKGQGAVGVDLGVDLTTLSRDASDLTVDLHGTHSPVSGSEGAMFTATVGGTIIDSWAADPGGNLDRTVTIPAADVARFSTLELSLRVSGSAGGCTETQPIELTVDGDSRVTLGQPSRPAMRGFQSIPQVLMPEFVVATTFNTVEATQRAIRLLADFQATSANALRPRWVTVDEARSSSEPALIINSREHPAGLSLPLELTGGRSLHLNGESGEQDRIVHFDKDFEFAGVQVAENGGRPVVVASSSSGEGELDRTLDWIEAEPQRFSSMTGNVLFTAEGRDPVELDTDEGAVETAQQRAESRTEPILAVTAAATLLVLLALAGWWFVRRRRPAAENPRR